MAKSVRRDLRRAVGVSVVETIQQAEESVGGLGNVVNALRRDVVDLAVDHATFKQQHAGEVSALIAEQNVYTLFIRRPFWGRLRWLVTGR